MVIFFFLLTNFIFHGPIYAVDSEASLTQQIEEYTKKLYDLAKSKDTLSNQLKYLDAQYSQTQLKILQTEQSIDLLQKEIVILTDKISKLDISLNDLTAQYIEQVNQNYRLQKKVPYLYILTTNNFNLFQKQYKYLSLIQKNSQDTLLEMETARTNMDTQKQIKSDKQKELSKLEIGLEAQKKELIVQKNSKTSLLTITKNDEAKYQKLKAEAENELSSLLAAKFVGKREVKKGEALGIMGNTGYSFGAHLHFGLYNLSESDIASWNYTSDIDASDYLKNNIWPMSDPIEITQERGKTKYSYLYTDRFHHGIDMVSVNKTVRVVNDGVAYFYRNTASSLGNHVKVFHSDGKMSLYLHLQ